MFNGGLSMVHPNLLELTLAVALTLTLALFYMTLVFPPFNKNICTVKLKSKYSQKVKAKETIHILHIFSA